jgi:hypothetical protein
MKGMPWAAGTLMSSASMVIHALAFAWDAGCHQQVVPTDSSWLNPRVDSFMMS